MFSYLKCFRRGFGSAFSYFVTLEHYIIRFRVCQLVFHRFFVFCNRSAHEFIKASAAHLFLPAVTALVIILRRRHGLLHCIKEKLVLFLWQIAARWLVQYAGVFIQDKLVAMRLAEIAS